jgi:hypothetical protein
MRSRVIHDDDSLPGARIAVIKKCMHQNSNINPFTVSGEGTGSVMGKTLVLIAAMNITLSPVPLPSSI